MGIRSRWRERLERSLSDPNTGDVARIYPSTLSASIPPGESPYFRSLYGSSPKPYLRLVAVYRAVSMLADLTATLPFVVERLEPVDESVPRSDRTWTVLDRQPSIVAQPDPLELQTTSLRKIATSLALWGNAYLVTTVRDPETRRALNLVVADPGDVVVTWNRTRTRAEYRWRGTELDSRDVSHIKYMDIPGELLGLGPIQASAPFLTGALATDEFARRLFSDGRLPGSVIESPTMLSPDEARSLKEQWMNANDPLSREPAVLSGGASHSTTHIKPEEGQMIETRGFGVEQVAAMFGLDPYLLAHQVPGSSLVYRSVSGLFSAMLRTTLEPQYLSKIENVFSVMLPSTQRARFQTAEFLRTDDKTRFETYSIGISSGVLTPNEARRREGLPPLEGGDELQTGGGNELEMSSSSDAGDPTVDGGMS